MTKAWRIVRKRRLPDAFSGEGARLGGGRWNHAGIPAVYASESLSLAAMELFVHFTRKDIKLCDNLFAIELSVPDSLKMDEFFIKDLPPDWRVSPPPNSTKDLGTKWLKKGASPILRVPSAVIDRECNLVFNPGHPDFAKIKPGKPQPFTLDKRVWK